MTKRPSPKTFRLSLEEQELLKRLAERLQCSEVDVVRFGLAALDGLLRDGLESAHEERYGKQIIRIDDEIRGSYVRLMRRPNGSYSFAWRAEPGEHPDSPKDEGA